MRWLYEERGSCYGTQNPPIKGGRLTCHQMCCVLPYSCQGAHCLGHASGFGKSAEALSIVIKYTPSGERGKRFFGEGPVSLGASINQFKINSVTLHFNHAFNQLQSIIKTFIALFAYD